MDEKVLFEWKENNADAYSKFKHDLEWQLLKSYHQNILDLGDGNAEPLQSVIANDRLAKAIEEKSEEAGTQEIIDAVEDYKRFHDENHNRETVEITSDELNLLTLRRWHYDHPDEYAEFTATFQKVYDGDVTFIQNNFFFLMEMRCSSLYMTKSLMLKRCMKSSMTGIIVRPSYWAPLKMEYDSG